MYKEEDLKICTECNKYRPDHSFAKDSLACSYCAAKKNRIKRMIEDEKKEEKKAARDSKKLKLEKSGGFNEY